jgi:hypothetical protein
MKKQFEVGTTEFRMFLFKQSQKENRKKLEKYIKNNTPYIIEFPSFL